MLCAPKALPAPMTLGVLRVIQVNAVRTFRWWWLPLLALLWVLAWYVDQAFVRYPSFDGALNLNVSRALLEGHGYASFYERMAPFPIQTQTNGPYVLPGAVALAVFGITPFGGQAVNLAYLFAFCCLAWLLLQRIADNRVVATLGVLVALQTPGMAELGLDGFGEVPALTWMLAAVLALARQFDRSDFRWCLLGGLLLGLSFLTKTVALIWFPPIIGLYLALRWQQSGWRVALRDALAGGFGIALALAAWEVFRLLSLGGFRDYLAWWDAQYLEVQKQAGVTGGYQDTPDRLIKIATHLRGLVTMLALPTGAALLWMILPFVAGVAVLRATGTAQSRFLLAAPLAVAACYLVWWLAITPTEMMWLRRILIALVLLQLVALPLAWRLRKHAWLPRVLGVALAALSLWLACAHQLLLHRPDARAGAAKEAALFEAVRALPANASVFGSGWWQAPVAALYSGRAMLNEEAWDNVRLASLPGPAYLVLDRYAVALGDHLRWRLDWRCECEPVFVGGGGRIYRIHALYPAPEASGVQTRRIHVDTDLAGAGFAEPQDGARWAERDARMRLPEGRYARLVFDYFVPDGVRYLSTDSPILRIRRGDCTLAEVPLTPGPHSELIEDRCDNDVHELHFEASSQLDPATIRPDTRPLAWLFRGLELHPATP